MGRVAAPGGAPREGQGLARRKPWTRRRAPRGAGAGKEHLATAPDGSPRFAERRGAARRSRRRDGTCDHGGAAWPSWAFPLLREDGTAWHPNDELERAAGRSGAQPSSARSGFRPGGSDPLPRGRRCGHGRGRTRWCSGTRPLGSCAPAGARLGLRQFREPSAPPQRGLLAGAGSRGHDPTARVPLSSPPDGSSGRPTLAPAQARFVSEVPTEAKQASHLRVDTRCAPAASARKGPARKSEERRWLLAGILAEGEDE